MYKKLIKAIYDIARANGVTVDVGADMLMTNVREKKNVYKGSVLDFNEQIDLSELEKAVVFSADNYKTLIEVYAKGCIDDFLEAVNEE